MAYPLVSIIVPCYQVAPFVEACIRSILCQSIHDIECIAVDDASTDDTPALLDRLAKEDTRLKVIPLSANGGVSHARNIALANCAGQWIMFVDGDDFLPKNSLELLLNDAKENPTASLICGNATHYSADGSTPLRSHFKTCGKALLDVFATPGLFEKHQDNFNNCCFKLFRRELIGGQLFSEDLRYGEDTLFCHQYILKNHATVSLDYDISVYAYRQLPSSCIHAATMEQRLHNLEVVITALNKLQKETNFPFFLARRKAPEYLWVVKKFARDKGEQFQELRHLMTSDFYREELKNALHESRKIRHKIVLFLLEHGHLSAIRWW